MINKKVITYYDYENHFTHEIDVTYLSDDQLKELEYFFDITYISDEDENRYKHSDFTKFLMEDFHI